MDSLDAQCLLMQTVEGQVRPPDIWRHYRSGALSCAYEGGESVFTWPARDVAKMGRRWRDSGTSRNAGQASLLADAHRRLAALVREAGLGPPDTVVHDLGRAEFRAVWEDEEVVLVVEEIAPPTPTPLPPA